MASDRIDYATFLAQADEDRPAEWVRGRTVLREPASLRHQELVRFLTQLLGLYVEERGLGRVLPAPFQMKLADSGREPDLLFVARAREDRLRETFLDGPADLVVEILSPESAVRDREEKFREYQAAGIPEYWWVDPWLQEAAFHQLGPEGRYRTVFRGERGRYRSQILPGFWLEVGWLWQDPLPPVLPLLRRILETTSSTEREDAG